MAKSLVKVSMSIRTKIEQNVLSQREQHGAWSRQGDQRVRLPLGGPPVSLVVPDDIAGQDLLPEPQAFPVLEPELDHQTRQALRLKL